MNKRETRSTGLFLKLSLIFLAAAVFAVLMFVAASGGTAYTAVLLLLLAAGLAAYIKNAGTREFYKKQTITLSTIYDAVPDMIFCKSLDGTYTSCNHSYEKFTGRREADIIGRTDAEVGGIDERKLRSFLEADKIVLNENRTVVREEWITSGEGTPHLFELIKAPLIQNGKIIGLLGIARDMTEHKEALKSANDASRAKSNFLAKMSHEIRTPMNAIIGMTELALRGGDERTVREYIMAVKQSGAHLLSIINDILDFSKIEVGKLEIVPDSYSFASLINDVISIIRMRMADSHLRFAISVDSNIPEAMVGDETRVRQVLLNVLSNAVKYTEKGFVSFTVRGEITGGDTAALSFEVKDSGIGIKEENIAGLFGEYVQFDMERNKGIEGTGLGLAITWNIVKAMGGDITVVSEYGKGSLFTVTLPQKFSAPGKLAEVEGTDKKSVIIFERRELYANSLVYAVENLGVSCTLVVSGAELQEKMAARSYTFLFISFTLYERNKEIIQKFGNGSKIILLTEFGEVISDNRFASVAMPAYCISIANILNGGRESFTYRDSLENVTRITAPDAKILIVDDVGTNLKVAEGLMRPYNMQISLRGSGPDAISAIQSTRYDLVFMDHKMPGMDGVEATLLIREMGAKDPYYKNVPIIALTANAISGVRNVFLANGFDDFLSKPIDTVKLNAMLEKWLPKEKQHGSLVKNGGTGEAEGVHTESVQIKDSDTKGFNVESFNVENFNIEGIDTGKGVLLSGGDIGSYLSLLGTFYMDGVEKLEEIASSLEAGNMALYTTYVHGMKSAAASVGAQELSGAALALEMAGKKNDTEFAQRETPKFLAELRTLLEKIDGAMSQYHGPETDWKNLPEYNI